MIITENVYDYVLNPRLIRIKWFDYLHDSKLVRRNKTLKMSMGVQDDFMKL